MPISRAGAALNNIVAATEEVLRPAGFVRGGRAFRRTPEQGYVQVIDFAMALSTSHLAGHFTVDLSIFVEELFDAYWNANHPKRITSYHCELSKRLSMLAPPHRDKWWPVAGTPSAVIREVRDLLVSYGLPFMARLRSRAGLVEAWRGEGNALGFPPRGRLSVAIILQHLGAADEAASLVAAELKDPETAPSRKFVESTAEKAGIRTQGV